MALVRADFGEVRLAEEATWQEVVLIPKGKGDYRGIGLMVVVLKVVVVILHRCLTASITYPNFLHEFGQVAARVTPTLTPNLSIS